MIKYLVFYLISSVFSISVFSQHEVSDTNRIKNDLKKIVNTSEPRNYLNIHILNQVADYIKNEFSKSTDSVVFQNYKIGFNVYKNVIASFGTENKKRIIIGAHYDVCNEQSGADDNASGVVALLEISRMLKNIKLKYRIDIVAYTLEEPPFFRTNSMGSYIHAKYLNDNKIDVYGMLCIEMIGYYNDLPNSQSYPARFLRYFYGSKGDYIIVVRKANGGKFARKFRNKFNRNELIETKSFKTPFFVEGIDYSDHLNYWKFGYSAAMITNTAYYRNKNYHQITDVIDSLNIYKMSKVIDQTFFTILKIAKKNK